MRALPLEVCDPVRARLRKLSDVLLQAHNPVVNRLRGLDPVLPQTHLLPGGERRRSRRRRTRRQSEVAVPEGTRRCDSRHEYPVEARPPPALIDERTIAWSALWRGVVARVVPSTW
ncbi:hypothetical protein PC120_g23839 [Phytophthora cactorum]|nr:hypothetical protein PC120_g23839 [Phytophthora cactorum]